MGVRDGVRTPGHWFVVAVTLLAAFVMLVAGTWGLLQPESFATAVDFPASRHFIHDAGAFQVGIAATLLLGLRWRDALAMALGGFLVANTVHTVNHIVDLPVGGSAAQWVGLALLSLATGVALSLRLRHVHQAAVVAEAWGRSASAGTVPPVLRPYILQKWIQLTTFKRDGTPVSTPVTIAVDGDRAYVRTFDTAWKFKRLRRNPIVAIAPSTIAGKVRGSAMRVRATILTGAEAAHASRSIAAKNPVLQGVLVPLTHRMWRVHTVHIELEPIVSEDCPSS
jgi:PPOX class probable F420-dependent enzyme